MTTQPIRRGWSPTPEILDTVPWYKQFWPWFLIAFPLAAVIGGFATLAIATHDPDGLVVDDYYKAGLAINQTIEREDKARVLGLSGGLTMDLRTGDVVLTLSSARPLLGGSLLLRLLHATRAHHDEQIELKSMSDGRYAGSLAKPLVPGDYHLDLEGPTELWRLVGRTRVAAGADSVQAALKP